MTDPRPDLGRLRIDRNAADPSPRRALAWTLGLAATAAVFIAVVFFYFRGSAGTAVTVARVEVSGGGGGAAGITANGYVVARTRASVSSRVSGRLARLAVEEGSRVRRGEVMAELDNADYTAAVAQAVAESLRAEASLSEARAQRAQFTRDLARAKDLLAKNLEASRTVEDLESQLAGAEARVRVQEAQIGAAIAGIAFARANLDNTFIRAPFDGTILRKDAEVGEVVAPVATGGGLTRGAVVTMADLGTLEVEVDVNEAYIAQIRGAQPTRIVLDAYPQAQFTGRVRQIVPTADRQRATVQVKVSIMDKDPRILPEMGARVEFLDSAATKGSAAPPRLFIPAEAVQTDGGATVVWVVREGIVTKTTIEAGPVSGGRREVRTGLSGGETIVLNPPSGMANGDRVNVTPK
ncbi:MAG: efflux RND transporter periplasmic adaptor subunit [Gemmatimonadales bacterium]|nr:efflux RND transporter periplasmic adaptor subunit [Gemmatimonadales bacterium]